MSSLLGELPDGEVDYRVLDTRGSGSSPWSSVLPLVFCCLTLLRWGVLRQVDVVHVNVSSHGSTLRKGVVVRASRLVRLPVVLHLHASSFPEFFDPLPRRAQRWVSRTFRLAARVVVLGELWRDYVQDVLGVAPASVSVLPNATGRAAVRSPGRDPSEPLQVLFLGRLGTRKGVPELLEALADARLGERPWRATLAGDGDIELYRDQAASLGLSSRIDFPGWVGVDDVRQLLARAHVLVLPSHAEGMPISVLEAFAAGVPVVCTPVGSIPEMASDGVNALVVPVGQIEPLADALLQLLEDETLRARLGAAAFSTWELNHSIEQYARDLLTQWEGVAVDLPRPLSPSRVPRARDRTGTRG